MKRRGFLRALTRAAVVVPFVPEILAAPGPALAKGSEFHTLMPGAKDFLAPVGYLDLPAGYMKFGTYRHKIEMDFYEALAVPRRLL